MSIYKEVLKKYWGYPDFRPLQEDIIKSAADQKKDTLGLLPTGGGKSIIFQVPALALQGLCLVITPLIALMKDQVQNLHKQKIKAAAIYSGMTAREIDITLNNACYGAYKFLYLSPERLATKLFLTRLQDMKVNLVAIDEAHCISQWGYDFRPAYLNIADIKEHLPDVPFLALTATATPEVAIDIQDKLKFKTHNLFQKSFARDNLIYIVRNVEDKMKYLLKIVTKDQGTGVVYVRSRKKTFETAKFLRENGISADYYHAGIDPKLKDQKQADWKADKIRIIVSTNAFGMGIDKSDVRFVVHLDLPDSPEAYFQEAGRGGRDGKIAYAVLLYSKADKLNAEKRLKMAFPERKVIKRVYEALANYYQIPEGEGKGTVRLFGIKDFVQKFKLPISTVFSSMKFLQSDGYLDFTENDFTPSKVFFEVGRDDLYKFQVSNLHYDTFIKLLLRTYTGLFSNYTAIDEDFLAKKANTSVSVIVEYLQYIAKAGIIKYIPQTRKPFIIFTENRLSTRRLKISKEKYDEKKKRFVKRIEAMVYYADSTAKCRSQILLAYFGETDAARCGQCDVCRKRNTLNISEYEFENILEEIKRTLKEQPQLPDIIIDNLSAEEKKVIKVIRWLLDNEEVHYKKDGKLAWGMKGEIFQ